MVKTECVLYKKKSVISVVFLFIITKSSYSRKKKYLRAEEWIVFK